MGTDEPEKTISKAVASSSKKTVAPSGKAVSQGKNWAIVVLLQLAVAGFVLYRLVGMGVLDATPVLNAMGLNQRIPCGHLNSTEFLVLSNRVVVPGGVVPAIVHVKGERIEAVYPKPPAGQAISLELQQLLETVPGLDYGNAVVGPGLIDVHVHMNEPGREDWEGVTTATLAAAAGGVTTVVDMPLNSAPATTTPELLKQKIAVAKAKAHVNTAFWGGLVPDNAADHSTLDAMLSAGALGFKAFMHPSGIQDFPHVNATHLQSALPLVKRRGVKVMVHAEDADYAVLPQADPRTHAAWLESHPRAMEKGALRTLLRLMYSTNSTAWSPGFGIHVAHLSDADMLGELHHAKEAGLPLTVETCPHYLLFASEEVPEGDTRFKCAPPIREGDNRERLWQGLAFGVIDIVSSDHSPAPPFMKRFEDGDFMKAWGGISGLQYGLPATWAAMPGRDLPLDLVHRWWGYAPAKLTGLDAFKGLLAAGYDADLVVWSPEDAADTTPEGLHHKHKATPYANMQLSGKVLGTFVRGSQVFASDKGPAQAVCGGPLLRQQALARTAQQLRFVAKATKAAAATAKAAGGVSQEL